MYTILFIFLTLILCILLSRFLPVGWTISKKLLVSYGLLFSFNVVIGYIFFVIRLPMSNVSIILIYILICIIMLWKFGVKFNMRFSSIVSKIHLQDTVIVIFSFFIITVALLPSINFREHKLQLATIAAEDTINHFFILNGISKNNGYIYNDKSFDTRMPIGLQSYPQAVHLNIFLSIPDSASVETLLIHYRLAMILYFTFLFSVLLTFVFDLVKTTRFKTLILFFSPVVLSIIFLSDIYSGIYLHGFTTQIVALSMLLIGMQIISGRQEFGSNKFWLVMIIAINASIAGAWFFISPIFLLYTMLIVWKMSVPKKIMYIGLCTLAVLPPIYFSLANGSLGQVNASGGIYRLPVEYYIIFFIAIAWMCYNYDKLRNEVFLNVLRLLLISALFSVAIASYQLMSNGSFSYYFYKSLYTPVLLSTILVTATTILLTIFILKKIGNKNVLLPLTALLCIMFALASIFNIRSSQLAINIAKKSNYIRHSQFAQIIEIANERRVGGVIIIESGSPVSDFLYSKWVAALNLEYSKKFEQSLLSKTIQNKGQVPALEISEVKFKR